MKGTSRRGRLGEPFKGGLIRHQGDMPEFLYRYRPITSDSLQRIVDFEIAQEGIFLAGLGDLNDPCEGRFRFAFKGKREEIFNYWLAALATERPEWPMEALKRNAEARTQQILNNNFFGPTEGMSYVREVLGKVIRVACFTNDPLNPVMWAHYGYSHLDTQISTSGGGVCFQYSAGEGWRECNVHPVIYSDAIPEIDVLSMASNEPAAMKSMFTKTPHWSYESEWRLLAIINARPPFPDNLTANSRIAASDCLRAIIFGLNVDPTVMNELIGAGKKVRQDMEFKKVYMNPESHQLELRKITESV